MARKKRSKHIERKKAFKSPKNALQLNQKWRYLLWAIALAAAILAAINHVSVIHWFSEANWMLVKDYLAIVLTWPVAALILGLIFMYRFNDSIHVFLSKMDRLKALGFEVSQQQSTIPYEPGETKEQKTVKKLESKIDDGSVTLTKKQAGELISLLETMDFKFLNLHLVPNTKIALRMMAQIGIEKSTFLQAYNVSTQVTDQVAERQAILSALLDAGLIYEDNNILKATDKGLRFLAFIGMPVQQAQPTT